MPLPLVATTILAVSTRIIGVERSFRCALWQRASSLTRRLRENSKAKGPFDAWHRMVLKTPMLLAPPEWRVRFGQTLQLGCAVRGYGNEVPCCCRISSMSDFVMRPSAFTSLRKFP